jgi:outer membrane lipoprotein carrier protein
MKIKQLVAAMVVALSPVLASAADAPTQLRQFIAKVQSATGQFTQQKVGTQASGSSAQSGEFSFQRPGKFKWAVKKPYEQLIVSDGQRVHQFDPDLLQVTERSVDSSIGASPAAILFGSGSLDKAFDISSRPAKDGLDWLRAKPRSADAGFTHVDIAFDRNMPVVLELLDSFGQTTRITLSNITANAQLPPDEFRFVAPPGTDVVKMQ